MKFSFGKNWQAYLNGLTSERIEIAKKSIQDFYSLDTLKEKSFLDIFNRFSRSFKFSIGPDFQKREPADKN